MAKVKYNGGNTPIEVLTLMGETIAGSVGTVDPMYVRELDEQCQRLCAAFGASERVLRTSLPTSFTRHTSRLTFVWSNTLPFALYPTTGPLLTPFVSVFTSWAIQSIEVRLLHLRRQQLLKVSRFSHTFLLEPLQDIGVQLEEPFFVLPLRQYSDGMFDAIGQIERNYKKYTLPSAKDEDSKEE